MSSLDQALPDFDIVEAQSQPTQDELILLVASVVMLHTNAHPEACDDVRLGIGHGFEYAMARFVSALPGESAPLGTVILWFHESRPHRVTALFDAGALGAPPGFRAQVRITGERWHPLVVEVPFVHLERAWARSYSAVRHEIKAELDAAYFARGVTRWNPPPADAVVELSYIAQSQIEGAA